MCLFRHQTRSLVFTIIYERAFFGFKIIEKSQYVHVVDNQLFLFRIVNGSI